jgi:hypothetical protein
VPPKKKILEQDLAGMVQTVEISTGDGVRVIE